MIETIIELIAENGFPAAVAIILLYDKIKTNGSLLKVVENNSDILKRIEVKIK